MDDLNKRFEKYRADKDIKSESSTAEDDKQSETSETSVGSNAAKNKRKREKAKAKAKAKKTAAKEESAFEVTSNEEETPGTAEVDAV